MKKILYGVASLSLAVALVAAGSVAFFNDQVTSLNNTFTSGAIGLKVWSWYDNGPNGELGSELEPELQTGNEALFTLVDLKPGDTGMVNVGLAVVDNDAWICTTAEVDEESDEELAQLIEVRLTKDLVPPTDSILLSDLVVSGWYPLNDADNQYLTLNNGPVEGSNGDGPVHTFAMEYCFGTFFGPGVGECNHAVDANDAQNKTVSAKLAFYAEQSRNNDEFLCEDLDIPAFEVEVE